MTAKLTNLLYIGNMLSKHGTTPTTIETLSPRLARDFTVINASSKANKILRLLDMWFAILKNRNRAQFVLIDTYSSSAYTFAKTCGQLCRWLKLPYIPFLHGGGLPNRFATDVEASKKYLAGGAAIVSPSGYLQDAVSRQFGLKPVIIPNFIDIDLYPFALRTGLNPVRILWVRSFHVSYQPHLAVEVLSKLRIEGIDAQLTMVGPDKDGTIETCKQLAKNLGVHDKIRFTGRLAKEEWIALSASHNVFLNTTSVDNTPVSVMEAMALGMPVVTTKVGGIPFLFEDGKEGVMVKNQTSVALAKAILDFVSNPHKTASISAAARKKAEEWEWEVVRLKWLELLN
jgi:glycosyltransferase involved in cell wall biosynthesis